MSIPGGSNPLLLASAGGAGGGYEISRSLRFNSSDSAYLSRTPSSAGNRKTWTWSGWVKRSKLGNARLSLFTAGSDGSEFFFEQSGGADTLKFYYYNNSASAYQGDCRTTAVFRDASAWYHIVLTVDTTQATASNRCKIYVNGVQQDTTFAYNFIQNADLDVNNTVAHNIGKHGSSSSFYFDGYLADIHFIDGQALTPSSFAETDTTTGAWNPKAYSGSYGTNGFHLDFADNSNNTATTLGKDVSGLGNNWTPNNLSVTAGAGNDSLVDSPSSPAGQTDSGAGGTVVGNYCTLNPLDNAGLTLSNGNLDFQNSSANARNVRSTIALPPSGKYYAECVFTSATASLTYVQFGLLSSTDSLTSNLTFCVEANQAINILARTPSASPELRSTTVVAGDIFQVAVDIDNSKIWFGINNTWYNSSGGTNGNPATGANATGTLAASTTYFFAIGKYNTAGSQSVNFGQRQFSYAAPAGFKSLNTANLPTPVIANGATAMDVKLYTGNGSTQTISGLNFSPDFLWFKVRNNTSHHTLYDIVRGATKSLCSSNTNAEATEGGGLSSFTSDGFSLSSDNTIQGSTNANGGTYVAWCWDAGSSTVTNTQGSITSQVRANASAGFSIVTYTGNGTAGATVGHGLGVAPAMIIVKNRSVSAHWQVGHASFGWSGGAYLSTTDAFSALTSFWNNTAPSSSVFTLGTLNYGNGNGNNMVAYCFAPVAGYSNGFSYTGNGSTDGSFVYLGFRPRLILLKCSSTTGNWTLLDTAREGYNVDNDPLYPNLSNAEGTTDLLDITSNGFKLRTTDASVNSSGATYIGYAWAETPFAYSRAR